MKFTEEHIAELNLLLQFDLSSAATGIKVHKEASQSTQEAVKRLFDKGLCTQIDGGYLTDEGIEVAEHAERTLRVLSS
ncbi:TIGR02647 family protein [Vibrio navarrensis]|uniref:TIGR02647 family protein n=1 Tax=Vibrio navarrensis TaxID=29495 RepID=A0AAJ4I931_9VIBR|nr:MULTISPECIES: TIGR02647 family protein [Vibrio]KGK16352.1 DNA-binding protein [Vibrio navarrensis]KGK22962.1 DNA-binding protein [Vibrio navarrensis]KJR21648.1 DNA-binding protein [Vibrio sp. S234-5]MBE3652255.1 TIGR02647 family protein [Vibrio navarrensis]MBE3656735.1 TIGR02647 family protein [Vibrio navarrensis]